MPRGGPKGVVPPQLKPFLFTSGPTGNRWIFTTVRDIFNNWAAIHRMIYIAARKPFAAHVVIELAGPDFRQLLSQAGGMKGIGNEIEPALQEVGEYIQDVAIPRMFREGDQGRLGWPALTDLTNELRVQAGFGAEHPMLINTGDLYDAITGPEAITIQKGRTPRVMVGGENLSGDEKNKFFVHMLGGWSYRYNAPIPPRPFVPTSESDLTGTERRQIADIFERHFSSLVGQ